MISNGLINVHIKISEIEVNQMDNTFKIGKHCIGAVMRACRLIEFIEGCQLTECDEIIMNDHRGFIVDVAIERHCQCRLNAYDKPHHAILNNSKQSHKDLFNEKLIEVMTQHNLKQRVLELKNVDNEQWFNEIDDLITDSLNKARAAVEGPMRSLPYSKRKLIVSNTYLYWNLKVKFMRGKRINKERMIRRKELAQIKDVTTAIAKAKEKLQEANTETKS